MKKIFAAGLILIIGTYFYLLSIKIHQLKDGGKHKYNHDLTELEYSILVEKIDEHLK